MYVSRPRRAALVAALASSSMLGALASATPASAAVPTTAASTAVTTTVVPSDDAYVDALNPRRTTGASTKLVAASSAKLRKQTYVKFTLPAAPAGTTFATARLVVPTTRVEASTVTVQQVPTSWTEETLTYATRPAALGAPLTVPLSAGMVSTTVDVTKYVARPATYAFVLTASSGVTTFDSKESAQGGPRLLVDYKKVLPITRFGMSIAPRNGEGVAAATARLRAQYGSLPAARVFDSGLPPATWNGNSTLAALGTGSSVIYSFKGDMRGMAAGKYDALITGFLKSKPAGVKAWVALHHEPEDDVERGAFTTAEFRAATAHVAPVIRAAGGIPTTILMQYTVTKGSNRNWRDYYTPAIDVMGWDGYNSGIKQSTPVYKDPAKFVEPVLAVAKETGKPFGWAEFGSPLIPTDPNGTARAAWLTAVGKAAQSSGAQFLTYWNRPALSGGNDYSLIDAPSIQAWRDLIAGR